MAYPCIPISLVGPFMARVKPDKHGTTWLYLFGFSQRAVNKNVHRSVIIPAFRGQVKAVLQPIQPGESPLNLRVRFFQI